MRRALLLAAVLLTLAGCGGDDGAGALADGRHFGNIRAVDASADPATVDFDVAEFFSGEEANDAAEEDGVIAEGEAVPNDYYIRNDDESVEELDVSPDVTVTHVQCPTSCSEGIAGDFEGLAASFAGGEYTLDDPYRGAASQYWVTVDDGEVVAIDEQYLP